MGRIILNGNQYGGGGGGGSADIVEVTLAEYIALGNVVNTDGKLYCITDLNNSDVQGYPPLIYSDQEREVGVWRDGKPLYQKSFVIDTSNLNTGWNDISSGLSGIDCKDIRGKFRFPANDNSIYEFPYTENSTYCLYGGYKPTNNTIFIYKGSGFATISDFVVTLRYTKTTDTAGSGTWNGQGGLAHHYSTSETVVGTWIDGKPLYEKTVVFDTGNVTSNIDFNISAYMPANSVVRDSSFTLDFNYGGDAYHGANWGGAYVEIGGVSYLSFNIGSAVYNKHVELTIQYTKTTD